MYNVKIHQRIIPYQRRQPSMASVLRSAVARFDALLRTLDTSLPFFFSFLFAYVRRSITVTQFTQVRHVPRV